VELKAFQLKVWALTTRLSDGQLGWALLHDANLVTHINIMQKKSSHTSQQKMKWEMFKRSKAKRIIQTKG
jgi:hypothetical protein